MRHEWDADCDPDAERTARVWTDKAGDIRSNKWARMTFEKELLRLSALVPTWRPIETAPKDGLFLAGSEDGRILIVSGPMLALMMRADTPGHLAFKAIAWQPLPAPPSSGGSQEGGPNG